jgi:hypothetical protein
MLISFYFEDENFVSSLSLISSENVINDLTDRWLFHKCMCYIAFDVYLCVKYLIWDYTKLSQSVGNEACNCNYRVVTEFN